MYRSTVYAVRYSESYTCEHILFCMVACACVSVGVPFYINNTFSPNQRTYYNVQNQTYDSNSVNATEL